MEGFYKALESFFILWVKVVFTAIALLIFFCLFAIGSCVAVSFFKETDLPAKQYKEKDCPCQKR